MEHYWKSKYKYVGYTASVAVAVDKKNKHRGQFESESKRHRRRRTRHQRHKRLAMETEHEGQLHKADTASSVSGWPWLLLAIDLKKRTWSEGRCQNICGSLWDVGHLKFVVELVGFWPAHFQSWSSLWSSFISNWHLAPASFKDENQEGKVFNSVAFHNLLFHCSSYCMRRMHKEISAWNGLMPKVLANKLSKTYSLSIAVKELLKI